MGGVVAIDVGGTTIKSAFAPPADALSAVTLGPVRRTPTPIGDPGALIDAIAATVRSHDSAFDAVGVVMPGLLDVPNGRVRLSGNLRLTDTAIVEPLRQDLGIPVAFEHDVRAAGLAELHAGAARGLQDAVVLAVGTGIAAAVIIDGRVRSADGFMGEIGHAHVGPEEPCVCGRRGCLEAVSSASAIARRYAARTGRQLDTAAVVALSEAGDPVAAEVWADAVQGLVRATAFTTALLGPQAVILGGGLAEAGETLLTPLRAGLAASVSFQRLPEIRRARHGDDAGCLGAAIAAYRAGGLQ